MIGVELEGPAPQAHGLLAVVPLVRDVAELEVRILAQIGRGSTVKSLDIEDVLIRVLGDVALIHARTTYVKADGQPGAGRYTDVWARRGDGWVCVAANVTRL